MRHERWIGTVLAAAILGVAGAAIADVRRPPPVPSKPCTAEARKTATTECVECTATKTKADRCDALLSGHGFKRACRGQGIGWTEVWCRPAKDAKPLPADVTGALGNPLAEPKAPPPPAAPAPKP